MKALNVCNTRSMDAAGSGASTKFATVINLDHVIRQDTMTISFLHFGIDQVSPNISGAIINSDLEVHKMMDSQQR